MKDNRKKKEDLINELVGLRKKLTRLEKKETKYKKEIAKLRDASIRDVLTGLLNRRGFFDIAEKQCEIAGRNNLNLSFLFLDLDGMKKINDKFGHKTGDNALANTADTLTTSFRSSDIIARIGGDEFVVIVMETPETDVDVLTKRLRSNLRAFNKQKKEPYKLALSLGLTQYTHENPCSVDELITEADKLMYKQKNKKKH